MEEDSLSDNVTDAALFFRMNVCMMQPERIRESSLKNLAAQIGAQRAGLPAHSSSSPTYFFFYY